MKQVILICLLASMVICSCTKEEDPPFRQITISLKISSDTVHVGDTINLSVKAYNASHFEVISSDLYNFRALTPTKIFPFKAFKPGKYILSVVADNPDYRALKTTENKDIFVVVVP